MGHPGSFPNPNPLQVSEGSLPTTIMRVSMDKNEENKEIETSLMEIKIFSHSSIEGEK